MLNMINKTRKFPREFDDFIRKKEIYAELVINYDLPYYLHNVKGCYEFSVPKNFFISLPAIERSIVINIESSWKEDQGIALRESTFAIKGDKYSFQSSSVQVLIQVYKTEIEEVKKMFELQGEFVELIQKTLEIFIIKYNINKNGNFFISPTATDCSMFCIFLYKNWIQIKEMVKFFISSNISDNKSYEIIDEKYEDSLDINIYKYFFNKSKYSSRNFDYIDTITSSAIALESFVYFVLRENLSDEVLIDKYTFDSIKEKYFSVAQLVRKMIDDGYIINKNNIGRRIIKDKINGVLNPRNNLMHGKLKDFIGLRDESIKSNEALIYLFGNLEINKIIISKSIAEKKLILKYEDEMVIDIINESFSLDINEKLEKLNEGLLLDEKNYYIYLQIGNALANEGDLDKAINYYEKGIKCTVLQDEFFFNLALIYLRKKEYSRALKNFNEIVDMPEEGKGFSKGNYILNLGKLYILISRDADELKRVKISTEEALEIAETNFKKIKLNSEYYREASENLIKIYIDRTEFLKVIQLCETRFEESDYSILIYKAYSYLKLDEKELLIKLLNVLSANSTKLSIFELDLFYNIINELKLNI